ncbi:MAG: hypothetical protein RLZZ399_460 [Verrucomicrobiota bacterium]|jgi:hypothetical protein
MRPDHSDPSPDNGFLSAHVALLQDSFFRLTGRRLGGAPTDLSAEALYHAPFVVLSHDTQLEPVFTYGNLCAQRLFEMDWSTLTRLPSRLSAELPNQAERARLLHQVHLQGYIDHYEGVRISKTGKRFLVRNATVWNLLTPTGEPAGQAATFRQWDPLS